ncbi:MAG: VacB/RNase II family 3'-5' exoribonuclease [Planctomycetota bacterium]|nr:VacB/RNase II family 3'-5' exoribonuclease [Planctomycetota bacterium]
MPTRFTGRILAHLAHDSYRPALVADIERQMQIEPDDRRVFEQAVELLESEGRVETGSDEKLRLVSYGDEMEGVIKVTARGFAFVRPETPCREGDLFIPPGDTLDAISGDRVRCRVFRRADQRFRGRGAAEAARRGVVGRVEEILERGRSTFAGTLRKRGRSWVIEPDGTDLRDPVIVRDPHSKNAKPGDKVVFELVLHPDEHGLGEGAITEVLGEAGEPDVETRAVIAAYGLREEFETAVVDEARNAAGGFDADLEDRRAMDEEGREDLTDRFIFTIDPPDARDFDDAISITYDEDEDEWELGVHIADVAHFARIDGEIDREAARRGNSVYLPRHVIPMIPEVLSNGVCSLQEGVPRFTKSAFIKLDRKGRVLDTRLSRSIIRSRKRLTYLEAQALIDGSQHDARRHARTEPVYEPDLLEALRRADRLARIIRKRRLSDGMLVLGLPEFELDFDDDGHVVDAQPEDGSYTHTIIEMFMVEANEAVARTFADLNLPLLRRTHPEPTFHDVEELRQYARIVGFNLPEEPDRHDLRALLDATRDSPAARAIHFSVLRTLTKAVYSPALIGHFALAGDHYAHFTSPIRRYPDLLVHRAVDAFLDHSEGGRVPGGKGRGRLRELLVGDDRIIDENHLLELGRHCSETEGTAEKAERELRTFLVLQFINEEHLGEELPGIVTGVSPNGGIHVSLDRFLVDGLARSSDITAGSGREDRWDRDERSGRLVARRSGASVGLGDAVKVRILRSDPDARQLDLAILELVDRAPMVAAGRGRGGGARVGSNERGKGQGRGRGRGGGRDDRGGRGKGKKGKGGGGRRSRRG